MHQRQLKEGKIHFGSQSESTVPSDREGMAEGM